MEGAASTTPQGYTNGSQHPVTAPTVASAQEETVTPPKRKPGRPKGSGKKQLLTTGEPKVKRPVGRPRKDGLPAGSLGVVKRPTIRRSSTDATYEPIASSSQGFAQWRNVNTDASEDSQHRSSKRPTSLAFETSQEVDEWAELLQSRPNIFLANLLSSLSAPNPISSAGPSVEEAFKSNLVSLSSAQAKVTQSIPSLYSILKTFWLPSSPAYFSLTASASTARTPPEHRFLYWDPQPLVFNGIPCPVCSSPLAHKGRIRSGPIKVYDLDKPFFIIGCEYVCKSGTCTASTSPEGRKFASTDPSILRSLPAKLKDEFPAYLLQGENDSGSGANIWCWKPMGVSRSLWNMVKGGLKMGLNKEVIIRLVRSIQNGVPDETTQREEEEEEVDAEQVEDEITEGIYNHLAEHQAAVDDSFEDKSAVGVSSDLPPNVFSLTDQLNETYADAWRANAATVPATTPPSAKLSVLEPEPRATPTPTPTPVAQPALTPTPTPPVPAAVPPPPPAPPTPTLLPPPVRTTSPPVKPPPSIPVTTPPNHMPHPTQIQAYGGMFPTNSGYPSFPGAYSPYGYLPPNGLLAHSPHGHPSHSPSNSSVNQPSGPMGHSQPQPPQPQPQQQPPPQSHPPPPPPHQQQQPPTSTTNLMTIGSNPLKRPYGTFMASQMSRQSSGSVAGPSNGVNGGLSASTSGPSLEPVSKRAPRHCCKCGSQDCKGKGGRSFCMNACQDCGKLDCKGRNSRRPDKVCAEAWN